MNDKIEMVDTNKIDDFISEALKSEVKSTIDYICYNLGLIDDINNRRINVFKIFKVILIFLFFEYNNFF